MYSFKNLKKPKNTTSGVADYILIAPAYDFVNNGIKCPEAPYVNPGDQVRIKGSHQFKTGRAFARINLLTEKNKLEGKSTGDKGASKFDWEYEVFIPGSYAEAHEAAKNLLNTPLIALGKDSECGADLWYQLGCDCVGAYMTMDFSTGTTKDGVKGYAGKLSYSSSSILLYEGAIPVMLDNGFAPAPSNLVFLASLANNSLSGNLAAMQLYASEAVTTDVTELYTTVEDVANASIIQLYLINNEGLQVSDYIEADLTSEMALVDQLEQWLTDNGDGHQSLVLQNNQLSIIDTSASICYMGIAIPQNLFGDDDFVLMADDDSLLLVN